VPWTTDRPVQAMPGLTSDSGMIGSAARATPAEASTAIAMSVAHRYKGAERSGAAGPVWP
jgi:hypothetical protein